MAKSNVISLNWHVWCAACDAVLSASNDAYAKTYALAGQTLNRDPRTRERLGEAVKTQALYVLSNLGNWHGPLARDTKAILKAFGAMNAAEFKENG